MLFMPLVKCWPTGRLYSYIVLFLSALYKLVGEAHAQCTSRVAVLRAVHAFAEVGRQTLWAGQHIPTKSISSHLHPGYAYGHTIFEPHHLHVITAPLPRP